MPIILLIKIYLATWFITHFEPLTNALLKMMTFVKLKKLNKLLDRSIELFYDVISCQKCIILWTTLIITQSIWLALGMSFITYLINKTIN